jgi:hypothetical protein
MFFRKVCKESSKTKTFSIWGLSFTIEKNEDLVKKCTSAPSWFLRTRTTGEVNTISPMEENRMTKIFLTI